ncbi:MAG: M23 family metallopeptidase [Actinomycetota bacterium]
MTWLTREKSPAHTTTRLLELMRAAGMNSSSPRDLGRAFGRFPVLGYVWYQDDYGAPRYLPSFHPHEGTDLFAVSGTPVTASGDGYIWKVAQGGTSGNAIWLMTPSGRYYFYGHLSRIARGIAPGKQVSSGDIIGFVGDTGVAKGTYPHVHFEVHPTGTTDSVNPKRILDAWLVAAENRLADALGATGADIPTLGAANWGTLFDLFADPNSPPPALWTAGFGMSGATIALADLALAGPLSEHDWTSMDPPVVGDGPAGTLDPAVPAYQPLGLLLAALDPVRTGD